MDDQKCAQRQQQPAPRIFFVCECCERDNPEQSGHDRGDEVRFDARSDEWVCEECFDASRFGEPAEVDEVGFKDLPSAADYEIRRRDEADDDVETISADTDQWTGCEEVGTTADGYLVVRRPNGAGGWLYWSDAFAGITDDPILDTAFLDVLTLKVILRSEIQPGDDLGDEMVAVPKGLIARELAKVQELRPGQYWTIHSTDGFSDLRSTLAAAKEPV